MTHNARAALVTGASAGIGRACADHLHRAGWAAVGASRRGTTADGCTGLVMDVDDDASVRDGIRQVLEARGRIDALVAAAGWGVAGPVEHTTIDEARAQLETTHPPPLPPSLGACGWCRPSCRRCGRSAAAAWC